MLDFAGKRVLVTGDTGFVGTWLSTWLGVLGATVSGLSLPTADVRDEFIVERIFEATKPEVVFHLAAQAIVADSYKDPLWTLQTNILGTAAVLEAARRAGTRACLVVTSDKCYAPTLESHRESDRLGGNDPYSASKAAAEIVAASYRASFGMNIATARAGNIIGGGDWGTHRLVPDCIRAMRAGEKVTVRSPDSVRPWQHVLDAVRGYLMLGAALLEYPSEYAEAWNFGPHFEAPVADLVSLLGVPWTAEAGTFKESSCIRLNSDKAFQRLHWQTLLGFEEMVDWTTEWYGSSGDLTVSQIERFMERVP